MEQLTISSMQFAEILGIGKTLFYSLKSEGKLPRPLSFGSRVLWNRKEVEKWLDYNCPNQNKWEDMKKEISC